MTRPALIGMRIAGGQVRYTKVEDLGHFDLDPLPPLQAWAATPRMAENLIGYGNLASISTTRLERLEPGGRRVRFAPPGVAQLATGTDAFVEAAGNSGAHVAALYENNAWRAWMATHPDTEQTLGMAKERLSAIARCAQLAREEVTASQRVNAAQGRRLRTAARERLRRGAGPGEALCWDAVPLGQGVLLRSDIFRQRDSLETAARGGLSVLAMQEGLATMIKKCGELSAGIDALLADTEASRAGVAKWTSAKASAAGSAEGEKPR